MMKNKTKRGRSDCYLSESGGRLEHGHAVAVTLKGESGREAPKATAHDENVQWVSDSHG